MSDPAYDVDLAAWLASPEGRACANVFTLESSHSQDDFEKFLGFRLRCAFAAGWDSHTLQVDKIIQEHVDGMAPYIKPQAG